VGYDANPTVDARDPNAYAKYAQRLDSVQVDWWADDLDRMAPELAKEAMKRRALATEMVPAPESSSPLDPAKISEWASAARSYIVAKPTHLHAGAIASVLDYIPALLAALEEAQRERDELRATVRRAMTAVKNGATTAAAVALAICSKGDGERDIFDELAAARADAERIRPVLEAAKMLAADLAPGVAAEPEVFSAAERALAAAVDTYESQESTDGR